MPTPDIGELITKGEFDKALLALEGKHDDLSSIQQSVIFERIGKFNEALKLAKLVYRRTSDEVLKIRALVNMAYNYWRIGELSKSNEVISSGLKLCDESGADIIRWKSELYYVRGILNDMNSDFKASFRDFQKSYELRVVHGDKSLISHSLTAMGIAASALGDLTSALKYYQKGLKIKKEIGNPQDIGRSLNNIGVLHQTKGEYKNAVDSYHKAIAQFRKCSSKRDIIGALVGLASTYLNLGMKKNAFRYFREAHELALEENYPELTIISADQLMEYFLAEGDIEQAKIYHDLVVSVAEEAEGLSIKQLSLSCQANFQKSLPRISNKTNALELYRSILNLEGINSHLELTTLMNIIEILLQELLLLGEEEVVHEIEKNMKRLETLISNQGSKIYEVKLLILNAKLMDILGKHTVGAKMLSQALIMADTYKYQNLAKYIASELDSVDRNSDEISLRDRLNQADLTKVIKSIHFSHIPIVHSEEETPISLLITDEGGTLRFKHVFGDKVDVNEFLIGAYLMAISNFGKEIFGDESQSIQRIEQDENSILILNGQDMLLGYIYSGNTYSALQKLKTLNEGLSNVISTDTLGDIEESRELKQIIEDLVTQIFVRN